MILVHVSQFWPRVLRGELSPEEAILGNWAQLTDEDVEEYGDVVAGVKDNKIVGVYDVTDWHRDADGRVVFDGTPSARWAHLVGAPHPGRWQWRRGAARAVQRVPTAVLTEGDVAAEELEVGRRAVIGDFSLTVTPDGEGVVEVPAGRQLMVVTTQASTI